MESIVFPNITTTKYKLINKITLYITAAHHIKRLLSWHMPGFRTVSWLIIITFCVSIMTHPRKNQENPNKAPYKCKIFLIQS